MKSFWDKLVDGISDAVGGINLGSLLEAGVGAGATLWGLKGQQRLAKQQREEVAKQREFENMLALMKFGLEMERLNRGDGGAVAARKKEALANLIQANLESRIKMNEDALRAKLQSPEVYLKAGELANQAFGNLSTRLGEAGLRKGG
jgi:hypothetical protein